MNRFTLIIILTGVLYSCAIRQDLNGSWRSTQAPLPPSKSIYTDQIHETVDTNRITVLSDTIKPTLIRENISGNSRIFEPAPGPTLTVRGRKLTLSYPVSDTNESSFRYRYLYYGKYKRRNGQIIATFNRRKRFDSYYGTSDIAKCKKFTKTFYYSESTQSLYELRDNDTTFIYTKYE